MSNTPTSDPIRGELVRAGTFWCGGTEDFTGLQIRMTEDELRAIKTLPMYARVVVLTEEAHAALLAENERLNQELAAHRLAGGMS